jgi:hypothetical protein
LLWQKGEERGWLTAGEIDEMRGMKFFWVENVNQDLRRKT